MANHTKLTLEKRDKFIACIQDTGNVTWASRLIGMSRVGMYNARDRDNEFKELWDNAFEEFIDTVEAEVKRRAIEGVEKPIFYKGKRVDKGKVREYSDNLLMFYLKRYRPPFRDNHKIEVELGDKTAKFIMNIGGKKEN